MLSFNISYWDLIWFRTHMFSLLLPLGLFNYFRTLCIKCWVSTFHTEIWYGLWLIFADTNTGRGDAGGWKQAQRQGEDRVTLSITLLIYRSRKAGCQICHSQPTRARARTKSDDLFESQKSENLSNKRFTHMLQDLGFTSYDLQNPWPLSKWTW